MVLKLHHVLPFLMILFLSTSCHTHSKHRTNYLMGFCGEKIGLPLTEAVGAVRDKFHNVADGDRIINLIPDEAYKKLLYEPKTKYAKPHYLPYQGCCLHLEIEPCEAKRLKEFWDKIQPGDRIRVKGVWTRDPHRHPWMEIHPVLEGEISN
jgi:hypothetical protein